MNDDELREIEGRVVDAKIMPALVGRSLRDISALVAEVRRLREKLARGTCGWKRNGNDTWETDCGVMWAQSIDSETNYCPHCGRGLVLIPEKGEEE